MRAALPLLLASLLLACGQGSEPSSPASLAAHRGQWVAINYWAPWCKPCIEEIPELNALHNGRADVTVLGVNFDGTSGAELAEQERTLGVGFPTLAQDPAAELGVPRPVVLPTTLLVDPDGVVVDKLVGPQTLESLEAAIDAGR
ncbi:MAG: thioredoxin [Halioglobus sp.]|nr:thioredoxin [Halioglobus sp.]